MKNKSGQGKNRYQIGGTQFVVDSKYQVIKQIGSGAYGVVVSAIDNTTKNKYAIKKVVNAFDDLVDAKRILRQIKLLKFLKHQNIIAITDLIRPPFKTNYNDIYIITQLMQTDLHRVIYSRQDLSDQHIQYFLWQILKGLLFMHSANIIHRDLKPSNLLLNKACDLKICDLGLARGYQQEDEQKTQYVVTRWYRAPQVILNASQYTKAIDIWSVGCILAELLGRTPLFPGQDFLDQVQRIISVLGTPTSQDMKYIGNEDAIKYIKSLPKRSKQKWQKLYPSINPILGDLLSKMLQFNPDKRITVQQCLAHPYFDNLREEQSEQTSSKLFDWSWDNFQLSKQKLQTMVYNQSLCYHPQKTTISLKRENSRQNAVKRYKFHN